MKKTTYNVEGFDCPNCAIKVEEHLNKDKNIEKASINFAGRTMTLDYKDKEYSIDELKNKIKEVESDELKISKKVGKQNYRVKVFDKKISELLIRVFISTFLLIFAVLVEKLVVISTFSLQWWMMLVLYILAYLVIAYDYLISVVKNFAHIKTIFNETTLMSIASVGAFAIGSYMEGVLVVLLAHIGDIFEHISLNRSHNLIIDAIDMRPKTASLVKEDNRLETIQAQDLKVGDIILIKVGDIVPVDGEVIDGNGTLDTSSITGEFLPIEVQEKTQVWSGSLLKSGSIKLKVTKEFNDSTTAKILDMVVESSEKKSKAENFITKFARIYTPVVVGIAVFIALFPPLLTSLIIKSWDASVWYQYIYAALTFLVISCPCAIVISVPLSFFTGIGLASKHGIIVKGANYLDRLNEVGTFVTDKTGTLTTGEFSVSKICPVEITLDEFKEYVYAAESYSNHPIAKAIVKYLDGVKLDGQITNYEEKLGFGVRFEYKGHKVLFGNSRLIEDHVQNEKDGMTLYLSIDDNFAGYILLDDTIKDSSKKTIEALAKNKIDTLMLTGGNEKSATRVANMLGIKRYFSNLLPEQKIRYLTDEITSKGNKAVVFMGDGVNDAPSIILADVGVAMGALGSDAAIENANIVLTNDDPYKIVQAIKIAKATRLRAIVCIAVALFVKISIMAITLGLAIAHIDFDMMWIAVLADTGLSIALVIYAVLLMRKKIK